MNGDMVTCPVCDGTKLARDDDTRVIAVYRDLRSLFRRRLQCYYCNGKGRVPDYDVPAPAGQAAREAAECRQALQEGRRRGWWA
jgi:hypothetical protein